MARIPLSLDSIQVASSCPVSWDSMIGDGRVRFCSQCQQRVYHLSEMSRQQAESLLRKAEGRLCARFYRRPDGTVMTADCPVGLAAVRRKFALAIGTVAAAVLFLLTWGAVLVGARSRGGLPSYGSGFDPIQTIQDWINPRPMIMGDVCPKPPPLPPTNPQPQNLEEPEPPILPPRS
jgi:hypothetical protein